ncbi:ribosome biogenesis GTPase YqeH [Mechercharimyces sp. CAU 1602]|uniref:ribosome biogenesis GTPase YqeH n=1 Tax=Mechercharimyces sp. CAU 1602 TaxID=2973933 RepID=UPI0021611875|nr:ribosome biogenesis GTPase YqeH [Mechercharimyces sp. CAU 1602]MCS1350402.1 ribosome biogenesis GTPase YqeH [Mechercharimyces sp. CAU 1602]
MGGKEVTHEGIRCEGCGALLQTSDSGAKGFAPESALKREHPVCKRCFRIRHYNDVAQIEQRPDDYLKILGGIRSTDSLVVQVVDLFDFAGSFISGIHRHIGDNPLLLIANKVDLFPKSIKHGTLKEWVQQAAKEWDVHAIDVLLISADKGIGINRAVEAMEKYREGRDIYVVGTTNTGKSTFINRLITHLSEETDEIITTSPYPGTTLDTIHIPLDDERELVDTPGIVRSDRMSEWVQPQDLRIITPQGEMRPRIFQLRAEQTLFWGGLARIDYVAGERQPFTCYVSNDLYIHRTKLENADALYRAHCGEMLSPPHDRDSLPPLKRHVIRISGTEKEDIVVPGLGWLTVKERASIHIWLPEGIPVLTRPAMI